MPNQQAVNAGGGYGQFGVNYSVNGTISLGILAIIVLVFVMIAYGFRPKMM